MADPARFELTTSAFGGQWKAVFPAFPNAATSKRTRKRCQGPAVAGWTVCRFHGAKGGAPTGKRNGMYRHGEHTKQAVSLRRQLSDLQRQSRALLNRFA
jgi:hypothetical protein